MMNLQELNETYNRAKGMNNTELMFKCAREISAHRMNGFEETGTIGWAVDELRMGNQVFRSGWNGKGMYLELQVPDQNSKMSLPYIYMKTADDNLVPWLCSQTDMLATDWESRIDTTIKKVK